VLNANGLIGRMHQSKNLKLMEIVKLIGDRLHLIENGNKFKSVCPFHLVSEDFPTLLIDPEKQTYSCLKCGAHGGPEEFYEAYEGKPIKAYELF
jgi:DNA primase